jgi:hypothetical protein
VVLLRGRGEFRYRHGLATCAEALTVSILRNLINGLILEALGCLCPQAADNTPETNLPLLATAFTRQKAEKRSLCFPETQRSALAALLPRGEEDGGSADVATLLVATLLAATLAATLLAATLLVATLLAATLAATLLALLVVATAAAVATASTSRETLRAPEALVTAEFPDYETEQADVQTIETRLRREAGTLEWDLNLEFVFVGAHLPHLLGGSTTRTT